jgi:hypothetical protein
VEGRDIEQISETAIVVNSAPGAVDVEDAIVTPE